MTMRMLLLTVILALAASAVRADAPKVAIELNKLEPREGACRAYLVLRNATDRTFETLKLDLVMFDGDGVVARRLALETAPLPAGKTSLKVFDIDGMPCEGLGRVLLNGVVACADASGARDGCLALIVTSARGAVPFIK